MKKTLNKTTSKAKRLIMAAALFILSVSQAWAYDFSATSPSGHTLYYEIISGTTNVGVVRPGIGNSFDNYVSGNVVILDTVAYNGTTYNVTELRPILDSSSNSYYGSFESCSGLTSVTIPNSITSFGDWAFGGCSSLTSITIPDSVTYIGVGTFYGCTGLTSVIIPNAVDTIYNYTFYNCTSLTSVTIPNSVTTIGDCMSGPVGAFFGCSGLTSITIPNSVTYIGEGTFESCTGLTSITISNGVDAIRSSTFRNCINLTSVTIPNSVTSIGNWAFYGCTGLTSVTIGNNVTDIEQEAFSGCSSLTSVTIGNSVRLISYKAFYGCNNLQKVISFAIRRPILDNEVFSDTVAILKVPCGSANSYSSQWSQYFVNIEEICESITITATSANDSIGIVSGGGEYEFGASATITATPNEDYSFVSWNDGNTDNPRTITITEDATYIANFAANTYSITVISDNDSMGTVLGGGEYEVGSTATIAAIPNQGYRFVSWNDGNTDNPRTITVTEDATYIASFEEGVGIESRDMLSELAFHPNPTSGTITFNCTDIRKVEVMDAMGRMVAEYIDSYVIDLSKLSKGHYTMRITTDNGVTIRKVIRN